MWFRFIFLISSLFLPCFSQECGLFVPNNPLSRQGLMTPYELVGCNQSNPTASAFVQATIVDLSTGELINYTPLVITQGEIPLVYPTDPCLPMNYSVGIWFGFNGDQLTLMNKYGITNGRCVNGVKNSVFGQFAHCNAPFFFKAFNDTFQRLLKTPTAISPFFNLKTGIDGKNCPTSRDFVVVDQDQSDNLPVSYLLINQTRTIQDTPRNRVVYPNFTLLQNPSDEGLLDRFISPALQCPSPMLRDTTTGNWSASLAGNEIFASFYQLAPVALVPSGNPMVLVNDTSNLLKLNAYRAGVFQPLVASFKEAPTDEYCRNLVNTGLTRLFNPVTMNAFMAFASPIPAAATNLFTFLGVRFQTAFELLNCTGLTGIQNPIQVERVNGIVTKLTLVGNQSAPPSVSPSVSPSVPPTFAPHPYYYGSTPP